MWKDGAAPEQLRSGETFVQTLSRILQNQVYNIGVIVRHRSDRTSDMRSFGIAISIVSLKVTAGGMKMGDLQPSNLKHSSRTGRG